MKIERRDLYVVAGLGMLVGSFFAAAKALGGVLAIAYFLASTDFSSIDRSFGDNLTNTLMTTQISGMVHGIGSFLILFFGGRWMMRGPKLLDRWINYSDESESGASPKGGPLKGDEGSYLI